MTKSANISAIEAATNIKWKEWLKYFLSVDGEKLTHSDIATKAYEKMNESQPSRGWWSQSVAVAYEQHIGRRQPGQRSDGMYEVTVNKTYAGTMDDAMLSWTNLIKNVNEFDGIPLKDKPGASKTEKWRHWRATLANDTRINVSTYQKSDTKAGLAVTHLKLKSTEEAEKWRTFWKDFLESL